MDLTGKVAIVTGASSGIGAATVKALHGIGMKVVGFARRQERIEQLIEDHDGRLFALKVDVSNQEEILDGFAWVAENVGPIQVLINNAGTAPSMSIIDGDTDVWKQIIDTNFSSYLLLCREAVKNMQENGVDGTIINISSIAGYKPLPLPNTSVYSSTKFAICGMTENLKMELGRMKSKIRTTCLHPGVVKTEIFDSSGIPKDIIEEIMFKDKPYIFGEDIANAIKFLVQSPQHVQVSTLTVQATGEMI